MGTLMLAGRQARNKIELSFLFLIQFDLAPS